VDITTLIPAFKPQFLPQLLKALKHQSYRPARVIVSDDSPEQVFVTMLREIERSALARDLNLSVVAGPRQGGSINLRHLLDVWNGQTELFHILCDDDLIYPDFYRWHVAAQGAGFRCTVSRRWSSDELGQPVGMLNEPNEVRGAGQALISVSAQQLIPAIVTTANNWLGEVSNVVMHRDLAELYRDLTIEGIAYNGLDDIGTFLRASIRQPIGLITHFLGMFRQHAEQNSTNQSRRVIKLGHVAWIALALATERAGYLAREQAQQCIATIAHPTLIKYAKEPDMIELCAAIERLARNEAGAAENFLACWAQFLEAPAHEATPRAANAAG
jgi:hypothetical protein